MELLITKEFFKSPYPVLSKNTKDEDIDVYIYKAQNEALSNVLGIDLYNYLLSLYSLELQVTSFTAGVTTIFDLVTTSQLATGYYVTFDGFDSNDVDSLGKLINKKEYQITVLNSTQISIILDSTGKTISTFGNIQRVMDVPRKNLHKKITPYLIYESFAKYLPYSDMKNTNSGQKIHLVGESVIPSDARMGMLINQESSSSLHWKGVLIDWLEANSALYPDYQQKNTQAQNRSGVNTVAIRGAKSTHYTQGRDV